MRRRPGAGRAEAELHRGPFAFGFDQALRAFEELGFGRGGWWRGRRRRHRRFEAGDAADFFGHLERHPEGVARAGGDLTRTGAFGEAGEAADRPVGGDPGEAVGDELGRPVGAVRAEGDAEGVGTFGGADDRRRGRREQADFLRRVDRLRERVLAVGVAPHALRLAADFLVPDHCPGGVDGVNVFEAGDD